MDGGRLSSDRAVALQGLPNLRQASYWPIAHSPNNFNVATQSNPLQPYFMNKPEHSGLQMDQLIFADSRLWASSFEYLNHHMSPEASEPHPFLCHIFHVPSIPGCPPCKWESRNDTHHRPALRQRLGSASGRLNTSTTSEPEANFFCQRYYHLMYRVVAVVVRSCYILGL
jgi:hypothetical protein